MHADPESKRDAPDPRRAKHGRWVLSTYGSLTKLVAMGLNQVEDASSEFISGVQIVSPPPDQFLNTNPMIPAFD